MAGVDAVDPETLTRVDEVGHATVERGEVPGVVAGVARGEAVHIAAAGALAPVVS